MKQKSRLPARLDLAQSASGLFLGVFMWLHMLFVSSILLGHDAFYTVARFFEGYYFFGRPYPILVTFVVVFVFSIFIVHALLAMRKFPADFRQYQAFRGHRKSMQHSDTSLWLVQVYTGFAMFFLGSVHLYTMMTRPETIGPFGSADRVVSDWMWPLYLVLLLAVELHGSIGLYRLAVKWGWFEGRDPARSRRNLKRAKWIFTVFFLTLGLLSLAAYIKIGLEHRDDYGELYTPEPSVSRDLRS
ncbi:MAG: fumarate reductase cytochrome b subunit [Wenzhouxiangellaceae bacterium]|nr:fumarate reductase cytochrome b subunit [Wenzhouxiangellaceae bacterium]